MKLRSFIMLHSVAVLVFLSVPLLQASEVSIQCNGILFLAKDPVTQLTDFNELLKEHSEVSLGDIVFNCPASSLTIGRTCEAILNDGKVVVRYAFNQHSGNFSIEDRVTGQSMWQNWLSQDRVKLTHYSSQAVGLINKKAGLFGDAKVFQILIRCQAFMGSPLNPVLQF